MRLNAKFLIAALGLLILTSALDQPAGSKLWDFYTGSPVQSSPAIAADGTVYFGADSGKLYAFDPQGQGKWEFPAGDSIVASPAIAVDGTVIVGSLDGQLYAVGADGVERWRFRANGKIVASPAIGLNGAVHFGSMRNAVYAVNPDGSKRWEFTADDAIVSSPVVGRDGTTYAISLSGTLYALDLAGKEKWRFAAGEKVNSSPALAADGTIYFGAFDGHVYAINPNGSKRWTAATGAAVRGSAAVGPDGVIYIGSDDRKLYAFAPDGFKLWTYATGGWVRSTPAVSRDGTLYFGSYDNSLHAVSSVGMKVWEFTTDSAISSSPALAPNGAIYFGGWGKRFYAVKGAAGLATDAWSRFRGDARQSAFAQMEFVPAQYVRTPPGPAFPIDEPKSLGVTSKAAAVEEFARAQAAREAAMLAKQDAAARAKAAAVAPSVPAKKPDQAAEAKQLAKAQAEAEAKAAKATQAAREADRKALADAERKMLADNARVLKDAELARKAQAREDLQRAQTAAELARRAKQDANIREIAAQKAAAEAERLAKSQQEAERKAQEMESARRAAEAKAQAEADRKAAMELARQTKRQHEAELKQAEAERNAAKVAAQAQAQAQLEETRRTLKEAEAARKQEAAEAAARAAIAAEQARIAKREADQRAAAKQAADLAEAKRVQAEAQAAEAAQRQAADEAARQARALAEAERNAAKAAAQAQAQAQLEETRRTFEEGKRLMKEAEAARKQEAVEAERRATVAAELAKLAKREADQRAAAKQAADLAEAKRVQAEAQAAEAAQRQAADEAARQARMQAEGERKARDAERKAQEAAAARELAEAKAKAEQEARAAAEAEKLRLKEQEIARKVLANSEKAAREAAEREAREAARASAEERRRIEAERQKWEPVSGGFFRRLFGSGPSEPKVVAEAPAAPAPAQVAPPAIAVAPPPAPVAPVPVPTETVATPPVVSPPAPGVPMRIISDSAELIRPVAPAAPAPPAASFFTPAQPTVDPLAEQIEQIKQRAAAAQVQPVPAPVPQPVPQPVAVPVAEVTTEQPAQQDKPGFWSGVRNFFIRKRPEPQSQTAQRPAATWPPAGIVVSAPKAPQPAATQVPAGLAPAGVTATNFPRVQYVPVTNQGGFFLPRAMAMQTNIPGMPQPPSPPRQVREMRPSKTGTQGLSADLPGAAAPIEIIQGRIKAPVRVYATGPGRVVPDLNGADLEVGQAYTVEAQPARGAVFLGWTGSIETNTPTLRFIMRTGTLLMANFQFGHALERELPEVAITAPADGARLTSAEFTLQGLARDNLAVARVEVSLNDAPWQPAQGTESWNFQGVARPGPNYVRVRAVDTAGNESAPLLRSFNYTVPAVFTVRANGAGTVEPDWNGRLLEVGAAYEVRATPAAGHVFTGWSGGVTGTSERLQFLMQPGLVVEANFAPRVASLGRGLFNGLVYPTNSLVPAKCGFFQLEVAADASFTGFLRQGVASHALSGRFDVNGQASVPVNRAGQSAVTVSLQLDTAAGERINGRFTDDGQVVELFGYRQVFDGTTTTTPLAGRYTFVVPSPTNAPAGPGGDAFGELVVDAAGRVRFAGELSDGTPVRHEASIGRNGLWPLHVPLAGGRGMVLGWITLTNHAKLDAYGEIIWHKPLAPQDRYYPGGFSTRRHLFGTRYTPTGTAALSGDRRIGGMLSGGNLDKVVLGDTAPSNLGSPQLQTVQRFTWSFRPDTGYVEGTFVHPATGQETIFRGALLQKVGWTSGYFLGQNHSGVIHLQLPQ